MSLAHSFPPGDPRHLIGGQIAALAAVVQQCPLVQMVEAIDAIRRTALVEGLGDVAALASHLESAIATRGRSAVILSYLDAMAAALSGPTGAAAAENRDAWLGSIAVRFAN